MKQRDLNQVDFLPVCTEESCQQKLLGCGGGDGGTCRAKSAPPHGNGYASKGNLADRIDQQVVADHIGGIGR